MVDKWCTTSGRRRPMLAGSGVWWCQVYHTIKAATTSVDTHKHGYTNSFIYSNTQFCMNSNNFIVFLTVVVIWWPALLLVQGICYRPQGQGNIGCRLQPIGPSLGVQQCNRPQPPQWVHVDGKNGPWARVRSKHPGNWWRTHHKGGRMQEAWAVLARWWHNRWDRYSHSLRDSSKEHEWKPDHTTSARHYTTPNGGTLGYSYLFIVQWFLHTLPLQNCNIRVKFVDRAARREEATSGVGGEDGSPTGGRAIEDGRDSSVHAKSWCGLRSTSAT
jgi:hypothetical protein